MISKETTEHYVREEICDGRKQCAEDGDGFIRCHLKTPVVMFSPRQCNRWTAHKISWSSALILPICVCKIRLIAGND